MRVSGIFAANLPVSCIFAANFGAYISKEFIKFAGDLMLILKFYIINKKLSGTWDITFSWRSVLSIHQVLLKSFLHSRNFFI